jgi:hypothetical protein
VSPIVARRTAGSPTMWPVIRPSRWCKRPRTRSPVRSIAAAVPRTTEPPNPVAPTRRTPSRGRWSRRRRRPRDRPRGPDRRDDVLRAVLVARLGLDGEPLVGLLDSRQVAVAGSQPVPAACSSRRSSSRRPSTPRDGRGRPRGGRSAGGSIRPSRVRTYRGRDGR